MDLTSVRLAVYRWYADRGEAPSPSELSDGLDIPVPQVLNALQALHDQHLLVLDGDGDIVMAHPWASRDLGFVVASQEQKWWGGCAWDSLAIAAVLDVDVLVATRCPSCGRSLSLWVDRVDGPRGDHAIAHFLVPVAHMWDDVVQTCSHQRLFCSEAHLDEWLAGVGMTRGAVLDLDLLWRLGRDWYAGRMTPGYRRRTPDEAAAFFADLGLDGDFWAVPGAGLGADSPDSGRP